MVDSPSIQLTAKGGFVTPALFTIGIPSIGWFYPNISQQTIFFLFFNFFPSKPLVFPKIEHFLHGVPSLGTSQHDTSCSAVAAVENPGISVSVLARRGRWVKVLRDQLRTRSDRSGPWGAQTMNFEFWSFESNDLEVNSFLDPSATMLVDMIDPVRPHVIYWRLRSWGLPVVPALRSYLLGTAWVW